MAEGDGDAPTFPTMPSHQGQNGIPKRHKRAKVGRGAHMSDALSEYLDSPDEPTDFPALASVEEAPPRPSTVPPRRRHQPAPAATSTATSDARSVSSMTKLFGLAAKPVSIERLPPALDSAGNFKAWRSLADHLGSSDRGLPILITGGVGSGKAYGAMQLFDALKMSYQTLDASMRWETMHDILNSMIGTRTFGGARAVLLQGLNGFQTAHVAGIQKFVDAHASATSTTPIVATCADRWALELQSVRHWKHVQLYQPDVSKIVATMHLRFNETHRRTGSSSVPPSHTIIKAAAAECDGDLRRCVRHIEEHMLAKVESHKDAERNVFDETRLLLTGALPADEWAESARNRDYASFGEHPMLLHHNLARCLRDAGNTAREAEHVDAVSRLAEALSLAAIRPDVHMLQLAMAARGSVAAGSAVRLNFPKISRPRPSEGHGYSAPSLLGGLRLSL